MQAELHIRDEKSAPRCGRARLFSCSSGLASVLLACAVYGSGPARPAAAQSPPAGAPLDGSNSGEINFSLPGNNNADANSDQLDFFTGVVRRGNLLGDIGGLRSFLGRYGITVALTDVSDVLGNTSGGIDRGATYSALTALTLQMDTQKAFGWDGGLVNVSGLQIRGRNFSEFYLNNLQTVSGIEAENTTRLWEVWYQQTFADGAYDVKFGQQSIDQEFMASQGSALYLNTMMGWPMLPSANLYAGGPAYPLSSLGIRLRAHPTGALTLLAGVFQDNPPGGPFDDDGQLRGSTRWGGNFNLRTGALFIAEAQYAINQPANGEIDRGNAPTGLPGTYKIGFWFDTAAFPDQRYDTTGLPLASPDSNGIPRRDNHNFSFYGVADQMIWQAGPEDPRSLNAFVRVMGGPSDRNLISFSVNAGLNLKAPLPNRDDDTFGVGLGVAKVSSGASGSDMDTNTFGTSPFLVSVRGSETFLEITYQIQVTPWLQIQPDFQYIFNVGGGIPNPNNLAESIKNEAVFGFRTSITF